MSESRIVSFVEMGDIKSKFDITKLLDAYAQLPPEVHEQNEKSCLYTVLPDLQPCCGSFSRKLLLIYTPIDIVKKSDDTNI